MPPFNIFKIILMDHFSISKEYAFFQKEVCAFFSIFNCHFIGRYSHFLSIVLLKEQ